MAVTAQRDALMVKAGFNAVQGSAASTGVNAQLSVAYRFYPSDLHSTDGASPAMRQPAPVGLSMPL